ncbi:MAG: DUF2812 domain-containing protein [Firmicutes bacterium]|nr:DUF2812 domain-containing protein [Bacillota bacterium]
MSGNQSLKSGFPFNIYYLKEMELYLEDQAASGLILEKIKSFNNSFAFRQGLPQKSNYRILISDHPMGDVLYKGSKAPDWQLIDSLKLRILFTPRYFHFLKNESDASDGWIQSNNKEFIDKINPNEEFFRFILAILPIFLILFVLLFMMRQNGFPIGIFLVLAGSLAYDLGSYKKARIHLKNNTEGQNTLNWQNLQEEEKRRNTKRIPYMLVVAVLSAFIGAAIRFKMN